MKLGDLMTTSLVTIGPEAPLKEAARRMIEAGVSGLPVTGEGGDLQGVITEADFVKAEAGRRAVKRARLLRWFSHDGDPGDRERLVRDVMTHDVLTLGPGSDHAEAARLMDHAGIKRVPVVDEDGNLVGIVSRTDMMRAFARPDAEIIDEIRDHIMRKVLWIDPGRIDVTCIEGNVSLHGTVETRSDAELLVELARRLDGVVSVKDDVSWVTDNTKVKMVSPPVTGPMW